MTLSNTNIREELEIGGLVVEPLEDEQIQPASIDLTLGEEFLHYSAQQPTQVIDPREDQDIAEHKVRNRIRLHPGDFLLATTVERVEIPPHIKAEVENVSSNGRLGLIPETAGVVDPGFEGQITLELANHNPHPIDVYAGMRIGQLVMEYCEAPADPAYGEKAEVKYQGQEGVTESRAHEEYMGED